MATTEQSTQELMKEREQAINAILASIAMEESALSNIMNAESEKIQYAIDYIKEAGGEADVQQLMNINYSVAVLLEQINDMQLILKNKMRLASNCLSSNCTPICCENPEKPCEPTTPCVPCSPNSPCEPCKCKCEVQRHCNCNIPCNNLPCNSYNDTICDKDYCTCDCTCDCDVKCASNCDCANTPLPCQQNLQKKASNHHCKHSLGGAHSAPNLPLMNISLPNVSLPKLNFPTFSPGNLSLPNITLPNLSFPRFSLPRMTPRFPQPSASQTQKASFEKSGKNPQK